MLGLDKASCQIIHINIKKKSLVYIQTPSDKGGYIDQSCHIGSSWTFNYLNLNYPENAMHDICKKDGQSNLFLDSFKEVNRVPFKFTNFIFYI